MARAQWHHNTSWYRTRSAPSQEREEALNWRLHNATSTGLIGEEGIHQIDTACNFLKGHPAAVTGFSSTIRAYDDHRDVPDTVQAIFEVSHTASIFCTTLTICNSFNKLDDRFTSASSRL